MLSDFPVVPSTVLHTCVSFIRVRKPLGEQLAGRLERRGGVQPPSSSSTQPRGCSGPKKLIAGVTGDPGAPAPGGSKENRPVFQTGRKALAPRHRVVCLSGIFLVTRTETQCKQAQRGEKKKGKKKLGNVVVNDPEWFAEWRKSQKNVSFSILSPFLPVAERSHPVAIGSPRLVIATKRESFLYFRGGLRSALFEFRAQSLWPGVWELLLAVSEPGAHSRRQRSRKSLYKS